MHTRESAHSGNWKNRFNRYEYRGQRSFPEVRKLVETAAPKVIGKTYAAEAAVPNQSPKVLLLIQS